MKRNLTGSVAAALMLAAALVQAEPILVAADFERENVIVESSGMPSTGGSSQYHSDWVEQYPFPAHYGPVD